MKYLISLLTLVTLLTTILIADHHMSAKVGEKAPDFTLTSAEGNTHSLSDFKGKYVVLEWTNYDCPFVKKHYNSKNMQNLQKEYTGKEVVWLSICSSAEGKQGHFKGDELNSRIKKEGSLSTAYLIDADGKVGHMYNAKTTPHMFIIDPDGNLIYAGGIDDVKSTDPDDVKKAKNYIRAALSESMSGKEVSNSSTAPYGCSVKYAKK